jgi:YD repeat-containing protein
MKLHSSVNNEHNRRPFFTKFFRLSCLPVFLLLSQSIQAEWIITSGIPPMFWYESSGASSSVLAEEFCTAYAEWASSGQYDVSYHHSGAFYDISSPSATYDLRYDFGCHSAKLDPPQNTWHTIAHFSMVRLAVPQGSPPGDLGGAPGSQGGMSCSGSETGIPPLLVGNPIHLKTGNKYQKELDFSDGAKGLLKFVRFYNSASGKYPESTSGNGWRHNFDGQILRRNNNSVTVIRPDGKGHIWNNYGAGFVSLSDKSSTLELTGSTWVLKTGSGWKETYDSYGKLLSREHDAGKTIGLTYNERGQLITITDNYGRFLALTYNSNGQVESLKDTIGNFYNYSYDDLGNLIGVAYPDETPADQTDNPERIYHYENGQYPTFLTGITNENGTRFATWAYDSQGKAITSDHAGIEVSSLQFVDDNNTLITDPLGQDRVVNFATINNISRPVSVSGGACSDCGGKAQSYTYDSNGFLSSEVNWNGVPTNYVRDNLGLEVARTEAPATQETRAISTEWHPDFHKPIRKTEPDRITEFVYDSVGRVLSKTVRSAP